MPTPLTLREVAWGAGWPVAIVASQAIIWGIGGALLPQFLIQFALSAAALLIPGALLLSVLPRRRPMPLRWAYVALLILASTLAAAPWNSTALGCPDC